MIKVIISLIIAYVLNVIDYFQTTYIVHLIGIGAEANPIVRFLLAHNCAWIAKLIIVPILSIIMGVIIRIERGLSWSAYFLLFLYLCVVVNNFIVMFRIGAFEGETMMTTLCITLAVCAAISSMACGLLLALYKHAKKK